MFQAGDGSVFMAGAHHTTELETRKLDCALGVWVNGFTPQAAIPGGSACMYRAAEILKAGGEVATNRAFRIKLSDPSPAWQELSSMNTAREHFYLVPLPDGTVLAVGGPTTDAPDLFDPWSGTGSGAWTAMAPMSVSREYHSSALLLPDGSVFIAGGQQLPEPPDESYQIYKPRYFFRGTRPSIISGAATMKYGDSIEIVTPNAGQVTAARLIRPGAATHSFDHNTRCLELEFLAGSGTMKIKAPA